MFLPASSGVEPSPFHMPSGTLNKLNAMAEEICILKDKLDSAIDDSSDDGKNIPEVTCALVDVAAALA